ncbi:MAG: hypothetical protein ACKV2O_06620 [Acidimicrobiales bacterium]
MSSHLDPVSLLVPGARLVFGELHGTNEIPAAIARLVNQSAALGRRMVLALELPSMTRVSDYVTGTSPAGAGLADLSVWWRTVDGRSSKAMAGLIDHARHLARAHDLEVVCLDTGQIRHPADLHERERHLARQFTQTCESAGDACVIGLVGSAHAWIGDDVHLNGGPSMATIVHQAVPELRTIQFESAGGEAWVMTDPNRPAGPTPIPAGTHHQLAPGIHLWPTLTKHVHGIWVLGTHLTASPPLITPHTHT